MDLDPRGVKRGACMAEDCDCMAYERNLDKSACDYCGCAPAKHRKKEECGGPLTKNATNLLPEVKSGTYILKNDQLIPSDTDNLDSPEISLQDSSICAIEVDQDTQSNPSLNHLLPCTTEYSEEEMNKSREERESLKCSSLRELPANDKRNILVSSNLPIGSRANTVLDEKMEALVKQRKKILSCIPEVWPDDIQDALIGKTELDDSILAKFVRKLVDNLSEKKIFEKTDYDIAAQIACEKYAVLKSRVSTDSEYLSALMRKRLYNTKYYSKNKKKAKKNDETVENPYSDSNPEETMNIELQKKSPSISILKKCLEACRLERMRHAKVSSAGEHLKKYSALRNPELLLWEFGEAFKIKPSLMRLRWLDASEKLLSFFSMPHIEDIHERTIRLLMTIGPYFNKRDKESYKDIMTIYDENTTIQQSLPPAKEPPRLIGIGSVEKKDLDLCIYVDQVPIYSGKAVDSLIFLVASYWTFDISFPSRSMTAYMFIAAILFQNEYFETFKNKRGIIKIIEQTKIFDLPRPM